MAEELQRIDSNLKPSELKAAFKRSRDIDALLDKERELKEKEVQLLILGSGCSGKTTFLKQLRILYGDGYTEKERKEFKPVIYGNVRRAMIRILEAMEEIGLTFANEELSTKDLHQELLEHADSEDSENNNFSLADRVPLLTKFWNDSSVQTCFGQRNLFYIDDSAKYFFENLERLSHPDYIPTHEDILHARQQTQGVQERKISVNSYNYRVIDVGGQKSQRKKWIHFFEGVTAVVFFVSLSSYDEFVEEDENSNAMHDSLELFEEISQNAFLEKTEFILFLNKHDLFVEKLKTSNLSACFPDYDGGPDPEIGLNYIRELFLSKKPADKHMYLHVTCATDTDLMKAVLKDVFEILVDINLKKLSTL
nr:guanine nucleotide-binding protein G(t) subunit alpha-2-like [Pocillopora verrucosa]